MDKGRAGTGGPVVRAAHVRVSEEVIPIGAPALEGAAGGPTVRIVREGDVIQMLEVVCSCGERIRIRCDY